MNKRQLEQLIRREIGIPWWADVLGIGTDIHVADKKIIPCPADKVRAVMVYFNSRAEEYKPEDNDCDDYAFRMLGYLKQTIRGALGFAWSASHAFVVFCDGENLWVIDPITKDINTYEEAQGDPFRRYGLKRNGLIVI